MAESMEKPPPYAPPEGFVDPKAGNQGAGFGPQQGAGFGPQQGVPPTQFIPPGYPPAGPDPYPAPQYAPSQPMGQHFPNYGSTVYVHQPPPATQIILVGGCPACRIGVLEDDFTFLGICLAILCFPLGILCCLAMRQRRCPNCGAIFGS